ncbi:MAG TPA: FHA domain-containing protein [Longimicrobium sp.]|nr:FHA domain-containing protein [Longimicrobium sp.]
MANVPQAGPLATFAVAAGPRHGEQHPVPQPVVVIGRAAACAVVIDDDSVSAEHARLEWDLGAWRITDLGSINGTAVEGVKLAPNVPTPLPYGTTVRFGGVKLQFRQVAEADPAAARQSFAPPPPPKTLKEERTGFRFPVWLAVLLLVLAALVAYAVFESLREPVPVEAPAPATVLPAPAPAPAVVPLPALPADSLAGDPAPADSLAAAGDTAGAATAGAGGDTAAGTSP